MRMRIASSGELKNVLGLSADCVSFSPFALLAASFYNQDMARAIVEASHETKKPILAEAQEYVFTADGHRPFLDGVKRYIELFRSLRDRYDDAQIFLGIDHFSDFDNLGALFSVMSLEEIAFVMVDGSKLSPEDNLVKTDAISDAGDRLNVFVEGHYGRGIDGEIGDQSYAGLALGVLEFVRATDLDGINYAVGTHHGGGTADFDAEKLRYVQGFLKRNGNRTPYGMHGASSLGDREIREQRGHYNKLNIATNFVIAYAKMLSDRGQLPQDASLQLDILMSRPDEQDKKQATKNLKRIVCSTELATRETQDISKLVYEVKRYVQLISA